MDWGAGHLTIIVGTGGGPFANKKCPQGRAFELFFKCPGGMLAAGIDLHITKTRADAETRKVKSTETK